MPSEVKKIIVLVGSLRKESFSRKIAKTLAAIAPKSIDLQIFEIEHLSMYNQDLDDVPPQGWIEFRNEIKKSDGVLFVTPEYNRSVPGVLKNAIDIASRPYGQNALDGKAGGVISVSIGAIGGFGANHHLRQSLMYLNVQVMQQPEAYVGDIAKYFSQTGDLTNNSTREFLVKFINAFADHIEKHHSNSTMEGESQWKLSSKRPDEASAATLN